MCEITFDSKALKEFKKLAINSEVQKILKKKLDKLESKGCHGKIIDAKFSIYELKNKKPAIRLYFYPRGDSEIRILGFQIKKSDGSQKKYIKELLKRFTILSLFLYKSYFFQIPLLFFLSTRYSVLHRLFLLKTL